MLAISISLSMHFLFLTIFLRCLQDNLSGPRVKELLHLLMALMSSAFEKEAQTVTSLLGIYSKRWISICLSMHFLFLTIFLRCLQDNLSGPRV